MEREADVPELASQPRVTLAADTLRFRFFFVHDPEQKPLRSTHLQKDVASWVSFAILVHTPSPDDSRFFMHRQMLGVLFHPHDQPPGVIYVLSSGAEPEGRGIGRHEYELDLETSRELGALVGEFAVFVLDEKGKVLLRSTEPVDRRQIHDVIGFREGRPGPADHPPHPPRRRR